MKKLVSASFFLISISTFAQKTKIEEGVYIANSGNEIINLVIGSDNTFHISKFSGEIEKVNDSLVNLNYNNKNSYFKVSFLYDKIEKADKIKVVYKKDYVNDKAVYLGTQNQNEAPIFNNINEIEGNLVAMANSEIENVVFEIKRTDFLNLALEENISKTQISKFKIPENASGILISCERDKFGRTVELQASYDQKNKALIVSVDGEEPLSFYLADNNASLKNNAEQPVKIEVQKNWTFPGKKEMVTTFDENQLEEIQNYGTDSISREQQEGEDKKYIFRHAKNNSFKSAIENIAKSPYKFLVVVFDLKNKKRQSEFDTYITESEKIVYENGNSGSNDEYSRFEYYLATDLDKNLLSKNKIKSQKEILFYNSEGDLVYHTPGSLKDKSSLFINYYYIAYDEFNHAREALLFDKVILNKKATNEQILKVLKKNHHFQSKEVELNDSGKSQEEPEDYSQGKIKDKNNLYAFSTTSEVALMKWEKIVTDFKKSNKYDEDFLVVAKQELNREGFSKKVFKQEEYGSKPLDFELLDYIYANYKIIQNHEKSKPIKDFEDEETYSRDIAISVALDNYFREATNVLYTPNQKMLQKRLLDYYKKYLTLSGFRRDPTKNYLQTLEKEPESVENQKEYFSTYEQYFNAVVIDNTSLIENLDRVFTADQNDYEDSWSDFKLEFAVNANQIAWNVVLKANDQNLVLKAIKWSETSLELDPQSHYFYDTLARLYYKNGQREKAIASQKKAVALGEDSENIEEYKEVCEKMKNGTF